MFQTGDGGFAARAPTQGAAKPALLLPLSPLLPQLPAPRQGHLLHSHGFRPLFVFGREEAAVGRAQFRSFPKALAVVLERRHPRLAVGLVPRHYFKAAHDPVLHFVDPHQPAKLVRLVRLAFADHLGVRFEQAQHFLRRLLAQHHPLLGLPNHLLRQRQEMFQLRQLPEHRQPAAHHRELSLLAPLQDLLGLPHHAPGQTQQFLVAGAHALSPGVGVQLGGPADLK